MKRSVLFLQYILKQEMSSMIYQVLMTTKEKPIKNDFVLMCNRYLDILKIEFTQYIKTSKIILVTNLFKQITDKEVNTANNRIHNM